MRQHAPRIAIIDYGMGNIFSVKAACEQVGLDTIMTASRQDLLEANAVILPGVGAFGDAMAILRQNSLVDTLRQIAESEKPLIGICLGMQLLMSQSEEFGRHEGLNIIPGKVLRFENPRGPKGPLKVPHVCWNRINRVGDTVWDNTLLRGIDDDAFMYFVHSYYVQPDNRDVVIATTTYGHIEFCSVMQHRNIFACQGHPERSGQEGLKIYRNLANRLGVYNK